jgi:glyoxylase-like metal-dependent hydrolase (beta-lactamase superfamily II)
MMQKVMSLLLILFSIVQTAFAGDQDFEIVKVTDGVYAFISSDPTKDIVNGNSVAILCERGVVVFDANSMPGEARAVLAEIRKLTDKPVRYVINSHWHWDHWLGNQVYKEAFPDCEIISTSETRRIIETRFQRFYKSEMEGSEDLIRTFKEELKNGRKKNGDALTDYETCLSGLLTYVMVSGVEP